MKKILVAVLMMVGGAFSLATPGALAAGLGDNNICGNDELYDETQQAAAGCFDANQDQTLGGVGQIIINLVLSILGVVAVIFIVIGGVQYMTSQGDPGKAKKGRDTLIYAILGLVLALLAAAIVNLVLANVMPRTVECQNGSVWDETSRQCIQN